MHLPTALPFALLLLTLLNSCKGPSEKVIPSSGNLPVYYAKGFTIDTAQNAYILHVHNPWQGAKGVRYSYTIAQSQSPAKGEHGTIATPVRRIICLSTTHIAYIQRLGDAEGIVGVSGASYVTNPRVREGLQAGNVLDVGFDQNLNHELIISLKPDMIFGYGVGPETVQHLERFIALGIPVILIGDYLEESPLGRAEWIKVFGLLLGEYCRADSIFGLIRQEYYLTKALVNQNSAKPTVFLNLPWKDIWYLPGGEGYMAKLIADAGGCYLLSHFRSNVSKPHSVEAALSIGVNADVWLNPGTATTMDDILRECPQAKIIKALRDGRVFNNNGRIAQGGGNDFWETGAVEPHIILRDLVSILHPQLIDHELVYYSRVR